jgi:hypothetical protein
MACIWSSSVQLTWGVAALRAIVMNMHTWASRVLKPQLQARVLQILQAEVESPKTSNETPDDEPTLQSLFASPQVNATCASKPPSSTAPTPALRNMDRSRSRLGSNSKVVGSRPVTPSSPAYPTRFIATPRAMITTTGSTSTGATPTATATPLITIGSFGTPMSTNVESQTKNTTIRRDNGSATKTGASIEAELDQMTKSFDSTTLEERADLFGSGSQFETTKVPTIFEKLCSNSKTPAQSSGATSTLFGSNDLAQQAACAKKPSLFGRASSSPLFGLPRKPVFDFGGSPSGSQLTTGSASSGRPFGFGSPARPAPTSNGSPSGSQPASGSTSSNRLFGSPGKPVSMAFGFGSTKFPTSPTEKKLLGSTNSATVPSCDGAFILGCPRSDVKSSSGASLLGPASFTSTPGAQSSISGANTSEHHGISNNLNTATTSQSGLQPFGGTEHSEKEDLGANVSISSGFKIGQQSEQRLHHNPPFGNPLECAAPGEDQSSHTIDSKSGSETAHDTEDEDADSAAHLSGEDENRTSTYRDDADDNTSVSSSDESPDVASESIVDESESELRSYDVAPSPRPRPKYLSETEQAWLIGMGSLSGYELARAPYLRTMFMARNTNRQISMLRVVLGSGCMQEDCYWLDDKDVLGEVLKLLNSTTSYCKVTRTAFREGNAYAGIAIALIMMCDNRSEAIRWRCFRETLSMRSQKACSEIILLNKSFDLTEDEWAAWEDSALQASRNYRRRRT